MTSYFYPCPKHEPKPKKERKPLKRTPLKRSLTPIPKMNVERRAKCR